MFPRRTELLCTPCEIDWNRRNSSSNLHNFACPDLAFGLSGALLKLSGHVITVCYRYKLASLSANVTYIAHVLLWPLWLMSGFRKVYALPVTQPHESWLGSVIHFPQARVPIVFQVCVRSRPNSEYIGLLPTPIATAKRAHYILPTCVFRICAGINCASQPCSPSRYHPDPHHGRSHL